MQERGKKINDKMFFEYLKLNSKTRFTNDLREQKSL